MSNESIPNCIVHKDSRNIQTRLDYMLLFRNETKAKIIRIMETWTDQKRAEWFKLQKDNKETHVEEPPEEALWVTMSYEEFSIYAYGTMNHDTIKKNVDELVMHEYMQRRPHPVPGLAPQYLLDTKLLQEVLNDQDLPSLFEDIGKIRPPRKNKTPQEKYPQGEGINTRGDIGKIPPGTGEKSYPSKNISKNYLESTNNKDDSAPSLREDRTPAPISFSEEKKKRTDPKLPTVSSHSQVDIGNDDFDTDAHEREVIEAFLDADTVKVQAIKIGANNADTNRRRHNVQDHPGDTPDWPDSHTGNPAVASQGQVALQVASQQTPGTGTRSLAADPPVGIQDDSASVQAPIVSPSSVDAAQRTVTPQAGVGAASQDGAVQASGKRTRTRKEVAQADDAPLPMPKSDTREIQRRINEHRGYALEEKTDKIREAVAVKTWCNLHTVEEYERVMLYLTTKDKYWKLEENKYRIGGVTLAKETPRALNGKRSAAPDTSSSVPNFDDYVGNGAEERAARRQLFQEMKARGELIS